jgi:CxxC motif-containing protein (DUF1111 family)
VVNELTRADITAVSVFQATLPLPGRIIPRDRDVEAAIRLGEVRFSSIGCAHCHVPALPLTDRGWLYSEPNPFNPPGNLRQGESPPFMIDLTSDKLPQPRLSPDKGGVIYVPAYTDLKLHDICSGPDDPNGEPLDMQQLAGATEFFAGNRKFLTRKLWGAANEPPYFHHGRFTTLREAVLAHAGEALASRTSFSALAAYEQDAVIEFLKNLQVLRPGARSLIVDENGNPRTDYR